MVVEKEILWKFYCRDIEVIELELGTNLSSQGDEFSYQWRDSTATAIGTELKQTVFTGGLFTLEY